MGKQKNILKALIARKRKIALSVKIENLSDNEVAAQVKRASDPFLRSKEWKALRLQAIALHGKQCHRCGAIESRGFKMHVDHIKPRKFFPELALTLSNLQILCGPCNKDKGNTNWTDYRPDKT